VRRRSLLLGGVALAAGAPVRAVEAPALLREDMEQWVIRTAAKGALDEDGLRALLLRAEFQTGVIAAVNAPATSRPWKEFRPGFFTKARIEGGVRFWNDNESWLRQAREMFGVPEQLLVSIVGVETLYGRNTGSFRVIDAVATLAFAVPQRSSFFQGELEAFVLMCRELRLDPLGVKGSYAGAMGMPQFIPSSVRAYARDFDGDGRVDLWGSTADVIGSVANYMSRFGWRFTGDVVLRATVADPSRAEPLVRQGIRPAFGQAQLAEAGVIPERPLRDGENAALLLYEGERGPEYWLGLDNFWVITRYNRSQNYALAVWQLAETIAQARAKGASGGSGTGRR
jgi:membrane-bound lytic murein transglycosylase B